MRHSTRTLLLSEKQWEQILLALAIGAIASAVGIFLTRTFIDGIYRGLDRWNGRRQGAAVWWERI